MSSVIQQGLLITIIGMGLVFAVIIFLWWMMGLLVRATTRDVDSATIEPDDEMCLGEHILPDMADIEVKRRAAAAAVAVGLAIEQNRARLSPGEGWASMGRISPWQSFHRARQLEQHDKRG